jgi:hypothetical protein
MKLFSERAIQAIAESKIQRAMDEGEFDRLPGFGKPFEFNDCAYDPNWWIRRKIERESLSGLFSPAPAINSKCQNQLSSPQTMDR